MDQRLQKLEQQAKLSNNVEDYARLLKAQLQAGILTQDQLELLVWVDYEPAWIVQDNWIHSDHVAAICPCPSCWKGGEVHYWAKEFVKRWGEEIALLAFRTASDQMHKKYELDDFFIWQWHKGFNSLWKIILKEYNFEEELKTRRLIEEAIQNHVLKGLK